MRDKRENLRRAVEVAADAFMSRPFEEVRVADVAKAAGTSTATLFAAFGSKEALYAEAVRLFLSTRLPVLPETPCEGRPIERLLGFLQRHAATISDPAMRAAFQRIVQNQHRAQEFMRGERQMRAEAFHVALVALCRAAQKDGRFAARNLSEAGRTIIARLNYDTALYVMRMRTEDDPPPAPPKTAAIAALDPFLTPVGRREASIWFKRTDAG